MTELTKYIGPDLDVPSMGYGVGLPEVGGLGIRHVSGVKRMVFGIDDTVPVCIRWLWYTFKLFVLLLLQVFGTCSFWNLARHEANNSRITLMPRCAVEHLSPIYF